jgi:hypothetical protein
MGNPETLVTLGTKTQDEGKQKQKTKTKQKTQHNKTQKLKKQLPTRT